MRSDWSPETLEGPLVDQLTDEVRQALAQRWIEVAMLEHSSVASFARFTLQLMNLGAPAELLAETQRAAGDEVSHAQNAFHIASTYLGEQVGPGSLPLDQVLISTDVSEIMNGLIEEACFGETLGVAEVNESISRTVDPYVRAHLTQVSEDETRHAALAWRTL